MNTTSTAPHAPETFLDAEAVLHECRRLQEHLTEQDRAIVSICSYITENAPEDHPVRKVGPISPI